MKADWDDMPVREWQKKSQRQSLAMAVIAGSILTAGVFYIGSKMMPKPPASVVIDTPPYVPKYDFSDAPEQTGPSAEERFWKDVEKGNKPKQTVFNDNNYTPRGATNVVSTEGLRQSAAYQSPQAPERKTRQRSTFTVWKPIKSWDGHTIYNRASWTFIDGRIDGGSVCSYYRRGSIEFRECRKGAK